MCSATATTHLSTTVRSNSAWSDASRWFWEQRDTPPSFAIGRGCMRCTLAHRTMPSINLTTMYDTASHGVKNINETLHSSERGVACVTASRCSAQLVVAIWSMSRLLDVSKRLWFSDAHDNSAPYRLSWTVPESDESDSIALPIPRTTGGHTARKLCSPIQVKFKIKRESFSPKAIALGEGFTEFHRRLRRRAQTTYT